MSTSTITAVFPDEGTMQEVLLDLDIARWLPRLNDDPILNIKFRYRPTVPIESDIGWTVSFSGPLSPEQIEGLEPYAPAEPEVSLGESEGRV